MKQITSVSAFGYILIYIALLTTVVSAWPRVSDVSLLYLVAQPIVAAGATFGIESIASERRDVVAWLAAYMFLSLGALTTICMACDA